MKTIEVETTVEPSPEAKELMVVVKETGIEKSTADSLLERFAPMATKARDLVVQSANITDANLARACRLALRAVRIDVENTRKKAKEDALREGKAVDGMANILKAIIEPAEQRMSECERAEEIAEEKRKTELKSARELLLAPFGVDVSFYSLGAMPEETFAQLLENTKAAHQSKLDAAKKIEEERIKAENERLKEEARIREENEKLKREAAEREAASKAEREAAEAAAKQAAAKAAQERAEIEAKAKAERAAIEEKARQEREAAEAQAKKEREAREKLESENRARLAAEKAKADADAKAKAAAERAPDKKKLESVAEAYRAVELPTMATLQGKAASDKIRKAFALFIASVEAEYGAL